MWNGPTGQGLALGTSSRVLGGAQLCSLGAAYRPLPGGAHPLPERVSSGSPVSGFPFRFHLAGFPSGPVLFILTLPTAAQPRVGSVRAAVMKCRGKGGAGGAVRGNRVHLRTAALGGKETCSPRSPPPTSHTHVRVCVPDPGVVGSSHPPRKGACRAGWFPAGPAWWGRTLCSSPQGEQQPLREEHS